MADDGVLEIRLPPVPEYPFELIEHADRCWKAECENAERLNRRSGVILTVLSLLFGLGVFKIEWTVHPDHVSRIEGPFVLYAIKALLIVGIACFFWALFKLVKGSKPVPDEDGEKIENASDLMRFSKTLQLHPPKTALEARAVTLALTWKAVERLARKNALKADKIRRCEFWFILGFVLVLIAVAMYVGLDYLPFRYADGRL